MSDKNLIFWTFDNSLFGDDDKLVWSIMGMEE